MITVCFSLHVLPVPAGVLSEYSSFLSQFKGLQPPVTFRRGSVMDNDWMALYFITVISLLTSSMVSVRFFGEILKLLLTDLIMSY